eukprot:TRINITY_DN9254_c0_g1_i1.p1 TRINITY_DN9254_c0_g1~~TRINITY_DN9254_c0_g1_i1.p1  ORF type:complete len:147 (-),score=34.98 TRINITY_DN9254_c0_g1_i1:41-481(-)
MSHKQVTNFIALHERNIILMAAHSPSKGASLASCNRSLQLFESFIAQKRVELRKTALEVDDLRTEFAGVEIRQKGRQEEMLNSGLQDIRHLEKTLNSMVVDNENELAFLKKQSAGLVSEKIVLQQHVIALSSRVNNAEMDVYEENS